MVDDVTAGRASMAELRDLVAQYTLRLNDWALGTYCAAFCRLVTIHHAIEDRSLFPALVAADPSLRPLVERLERDHVTIGAALEQLDAILVRMLEEPAMLEEVRSRVGAVGDQLETHFAFEEEHLAEPLVRHGIEV